MVGRIFLIISLLVFFILLLMESTIEPALVKSAIVFFGLIGAYHTVRLVIPLIEDTSQNDSESTPSHNSA